MNELPPPPRPEKYTVAFNRLGRPDRGVFLTDVKKYELLPDVNVWAFTKTDDSIHVYNVDDIESPLVIRPA